MADISGSLVADFHRNLISGGIFFYPKDFKNPAKPSGKPRLLYEVAPLAMIAEQANGCAIDGEGNNTLDIQREKLYQRVLCSSSAARKTWTWQRPSLRGKGRIQ